MTARTMTARTMTARYDGQCVECYAPIAKGETIRWAGRGRAYHESCDAVADDPFRYTRSRGYYGRGAGRCEDAPCCGCC